MIHGSRKSPGGENGNPLQCSCLKNPMDRGAWWATVHGVAKSQTRLKQLSSSSSSICSLFHVKSKSRLQTLPYDSSQLVLVTFPMLGSPPGPSGYPPGQGRSRSQGDREQTGTPLPGAAVLLGWCTAETQQKLRTQFTHHTRLDLNHSSETGQLPHFGPVKPH